MKIKGDFRPFSSEVKPLESSQTSQVNQRAFGDTMKQHQAKLGQDELSEQMKQIHLQGDRLSKQMTVRELKLYKNMIKHFLEETVRKGIALKDTKGWDRRGRGKKYKILDEIDARLVQMGDELLQTEQGRVDLLQQIGEIRGLLINLLF